MRYLAKFRNCKWTKLEKNVASGHTGGAQQPWKAEQ